MARPGEISEKAGSGYRKLAAELEYTAESNVSISDAVEAVGEIVYENGGNVPQNAQSQLRRRLDDNDFPV